MLILIIQIIIVFLVLIIIYYIYRPIPLKALYNRLFFPVSNFTEYDHTEIKELEYKKNYFKQYLLKNENSDTLIIWYHGGCFIQDHPQIVLPFLGSLRRELPNCDILTFEYPLPYDFTLDDSLAFGNYVISKNILPKYKNYYICGDSAGSYFAAITANIQDSNTLHTVLHLDKLDLNFNGLISVSGFFDQTFDDNIILKNLFRLYVARYVKNFNALRTTEIFIPSLIFTSKQDFLYRQNVQFSQTNQHRDSYLKVFDSRESVHDFISYTALPETKECIELIREFINKFNH